MGFGVNVAVSKATPFFGPAYLALLKCSSTLPKFQIQDYYSHITVSIGEILFVTVIPISFRLESG